MLKKQHTTKVLKDLWHLVICKCPYKYLSKDSVHFENRSKTILGSYVNMSSKNEASIYLWRHFPYLDAQTFDHF